MSSDTYKIQIDAGGAWADLKQSVDGGPYKPWHMPWEEADCELQSMLAAFPHADLRIVTAACREEVNLY